MKVKRKQPKKAFLGAIIGGIAGIAGSVIAGASSKRSSQKQIEEQQRQQNKKDTLEMAQNLSASYGNQDYVDEFQNKVKFKTGGKMKTKNVNYTDRVTLAKKFKCGGRKKAGWGASDTSNVINGVSGALSNTIGSAIVNSVDPTIKQGTIYKGIPKENIKTPDYIAISDNLINPNAVYMRCGGRSKSKCGGRIQKVCGGKK